MTEQQFGRYRLLSLLGRGGMGEVWRAVDTEKEREVALKILRPGLDAEPDFVIRFRREAARAARLRSPHVLSIHDYGEIDGRLFIDMELIDGQDLGSLLTAGPLAPRRAVAIVAQVARALGVAHAAQLVHRDVKPSNILVSTADDDHTYLIDFGIVRALDGTRLTAVGVIGTPAYMAPECFGGEGDARSDVYSLGCVLFQALTGETPFDAPHAFAFARLHEDVPPPRPSSVRPGVPAALDAVVDRALAKNPARRYATPSELAAGARAAVAEAPTDPALPTEAPTVRSPAPAPPTVVSTPVAPPTEASTADAPPTVAPPARRPGHRRRWLVVGLVVVLILAAVGIGVAVRGPGPAPNLLLTGHTSGVAAVAAGSLDGHPVAVSGSYDGTVRIWDLTTGGQVGEPLTGHTYPVRAVALTQLDGQVVAVTGGEDKTVRIWGLAAGRQIGPTLVGSSGAVIAVATAQLDGRPVAVSGSVYDPVRVWDLTTGKPGGEPLVGHGGTSVYAAATGEVDGRPVAVTGGDDQTVRVWDLLTRRQTSPPLTGHTGTVLATAVTVLDGRPVAVSGANDGTVRIWRLPTGEPVGPPLDGQAGAVNAVATTQLDGRDVAVTAHDDHTIRIWDLAAGRQLGEPLTGHTDSVQSVALAEVGGRQIAVSGSSDGTVRTWDLLDAAGL